MRRTPEVLLALTIVFVVSTFSFNFNVLLPVLARQTLSGGPEVFGILTAFFGIGRAGRRAHLGIAGTRQLVGAGGGHRRLRARPSWLLAPTASVLGASLLLMVTGVAFTLWTSNANSLLQLNAPDRLRGRVIGLYFFAFNGAGPLGGLMAGWLASRGGTETAFAVSGAASIVMTVVALVRLHRLSPARGRTAGWPVRRASAEPDTPTAIIAHRRPHAREERWRWRARKHPYVWTVTGTPDRAQPGALHSDLMVEVRDGIRLATDVYLPDGDGPFPTIMIRLPYGKAVGYCGIREIAHHWNRKGYAFVGQDCRGTYGSEGVFDPAHPDNEAKDGHDTVAWIAEQDWSSGRVALTGESYYAFTTYAAASMPHPALTCIVPADFPADRYAGIYRNGCMKFAAEALWAIWQTRPLEHDIPGEPLPGVDVWHLPTIEMARAAGRPNAYFDEIVGHWQPGSRYWQYRARREAHDAISIPIFYWSGWYDNYLGPEVADWKRHRRLDRSGGRTYLMIGPWSHEGPTGPAERVGIMPVVDDGTHRWDRLQAFYDRFLMGLDNGFEQRPPVSYFVIGADEWRTADSWPPSGAELEQWYLHGNGAGDEGGTLDRRPPVEEAPDSYRYDPLDPVAWTAGTNPYTFGLVMGDRRPIEQRPDVLVYTSEPFAEPIEVVGDLSARMVVSTDALDTDFTVALVDVFPDGSANLIADGIQRMGLREPELGRRLLEPGREYEVEIDMWLAAYRLLPGHRLRVEVSSSDFDRYDRNLNTAEPPCTATEPVIATQTVYHDAGRPSRLLLPMRRPAG